MSFQIASQKDWLRGVNAATGKATVVQGTVRRISNLIYTKRGSLVTVDGTKIVSNSQGSQFSFFNSVGGPGANMTTAAMIAANKSPASPFPLLLELTNQGVWRALDFSTSPATPILAAGIFGGVLGVVITNVGSGYTSDPTAVFTGGGGSGAAGTGIRSGNTVVGVSMTATGSGYTSSPAVTFTGGGGINAAGFGSLQGGTVAAVSMTNVGSGYVTPPAVIFSGGGGSGATGVPIMSAQTVIGVTITNGGSGYVGAVQVTFVSSTGINAAGTVTVINLVSGIWGGVNAYDPGHVPIGIFRLPQLVNVRDKVVLCPGNDGIPVWANFFVGSQGVVGSNPLYTPVTAAAHGILHQGYLWLWNTGQNIGPIDSPSTLRMCELDATGLPDVTIFPAVNAAFVDANDGTQGQGMISFTSAEAGISPTATLVLFKDYSTYQVTGLLRPGGGYSVTRAQSEMGCVSPRSIQFAPGFGVMRLTHLGIAVFNGGGDQLISEEIRPYLFQEEPDIVPIDWNRVKFAKATITVNPPMYVLAVPLPNILGSSRLLCYDLVMKQWTVVDLPAASASGLGPIQLVDTIKIPGKKITTYVSDFAALNLIGLVQPPSQGCIRKWMDGDQGWDGVAIPWMVKPPYLFSKNPTTPLYVRRSVLRAKTLGGPVTAIFDVDGVQNRAPAVTKTIVLLNSPSTYGNCRYGFATYGDPYPDSITPFDIGVKGFSFAAKYMGSGVVELLATDWHYKDKPEGSFSRIS